MKSLYLKGKQEISIFRTSVKTTGAIESLRDLLDVLVGQGNWNFDLEDRENILRINSYAATNDFLVREIKRMGFECTELF
ncbi:hypothetical protein [Sinomicrobium sp. M5D2P17]